MNDPIHIIRVTGRNYRADFLAVAAALMFAGALVMLLTRSIPDSATRDTLLILIGALIGIVKDVYGYEFGASQADKSGDARAALKQLADQQPPPTPPDEPIKDVQR